MVWAQPHAKATFHLPQGKPGLSVHYCTRVRLLHPLALQIQWPEVFSPPRVTYGLRLDTVDISVLFRDTGVITCER